MLSARRRIFVTLTLALLAAPAAFAQTGPFKQDDEYVTQRIFQNRVIEVHNRDPQALARALSPLTSGFRGALILSNQEFRTISVRDFPENIAAIEEAIRRLDTPEAARPSLEFRVHLLVASNDETKGSPLPPELADVVKKLQSTLGYKNFTLMGAQVVRGKESPREYFNKGVADLKLPNDTPAGKNPVYYNYTIRTVSLDDGGAGQARVHIEEFSLDLKMPLWMGGDKIVYETVGFKNPVSMREGERVVAGTTSVADKSVIVVLSATTTK